MEGSRLTLRHLVQAPVWIRCLHSRRGHRRRSSYRKKEDASLDGLVERGDLRPSRKRCPLVSGCVGLKVGAFLGLEPWLGAVACRW